MNEPKLNVGDYTAFKLNGTIEVGDVSRVRNSGGSYVYDFSVPSPGGEVLFVSIPENDIYFLDTQASALVPESWIAEHTKEISKAFERNISNHYAIAFNTIEDLQAVLGGKFDNGLVFGTTLKHVCGKWVALLA